MPIPSQIAALIEQFNQELDRVEQEAAAGINLARAILEHFPDNATLIQFFAYLNSTLLFVVIDRRQLQNIIKGLSETDVVTNEEIQEAGETLATELGRVLEAKMVVLEIKARLENLQ